MSKRSRVQIPAPESRLIIYLMVNCTETENKRKRGCDRRVLFEKNIQSEILSSEEN